MQTLHVNEWCLLELICFWREWRTVSMEVESWDSNQEYYKFKQDDYRNLKNYQQIPLDFREETKDCNSFQIL